MKLLDDLLSYLVLKHLHERKKSDQFSITFRNPTTQVTISEPTKNHIPDYPKQMMLPPRWNFKVKKRIQSTNVSQLLRSFSKTFQDDGLLGKSYITIINVVW